MSTTTKASGPGAVEITDPDQGRVSAVICTFDVVDLDGDLVEPGAITAGARVVISQWNHGTWQPGMIPAGHGTLRTTPTQAVVDAQFHLDTTAGRDTFLAVKHLHEFGLGQWSWSLRDIVGQADTVNGQRIRRIRSVAVHECSPVLVAASIGTRTLSAKDAEALATARRHLEALDQKQQEIMAAGARHVQAYERDIIAAALRTLARTR